MAGPEGVTGDAFCGAEGDIVGRPKLSRTPSAMAGAGGGRYGKLPECTVWSLSATLAN